MPDEKKSLTVGYYLVAFIDILGQKERLNQLADVPLSPEGRDRSIEVLKETYGAVEGFRQTFENFFQGLLKESPLASEIPGPLRAEFMALRSTSVKTQQFADTVVLYAPLRDDVMKAPINGVYAILLACGASYLTMLAARHACRGGIDVGVAYEPHEGEIYGQALHSAYDLERTVVQYPRIAIGLSLVDYLNTYAQAPGDAVLVRYSRELAKRCLDLLAKDIDGWPFLDVLGEGYHQAVGGPRPLDQIIPEAYAFVIEEAQRAKDAKNSKLAFRYALLRQYFEARRPPSG